MFVIVMMWFWGRQRRIVMAELCALLSRSRQQLRTDLDRPPPTFGGVYFFASFYQYVDIGKSFLVGSMAVVMQGIGHKQSPAAAERSTWKDLWRVLIIEQHTWEK